MTSYRPWLEPELPTWVYGLFAVIGVIGVSGALSDFTGSSLLEGAMKSLLILAGFALLVVGVAGVAHRHRR